MKPLVRVVLISERQQSELMAGSHTLIPCPGIELFESEGWGVVMGMLEFAVSQAEVFLSG